VDETSRNRVSRMWRKVKSDWDAWNTRSLAKEPIVRLLPDGTFVRVRLDSQSDLDLVARCPRVSRDRIQRFPRIASSTFWPSVGTEAQVPPHPPSSFCRDIIQSTARRANRCVMSFTYGLSAGSTAAVPYIWLTPQRPNQLPSSSCSRLIQRALAIAGSRNQFSK
jgi:hypothetical protein